MALTWQLKFDDGVTGPAAKAGKAAKSLGDDFNRLKKDVEGAERAVAGFTRDAQGRLRDAKGKFVGTGGSGDPFSMGNPYGTGPIPGLQRRRRMDPRSQFNFAGLSASTRMMQAIARNVGPDAVRHIGMAADAWERFAPALNGIAVAGAAAAAGIGLAAAAAARGLVSLTMYVRDAQAFRQSTSFAFEQILGSKKAADAAMAAASRIAFDTGQDLRETMKGMNVLLAQGFDTKFADQLMRAMADLRVLNPQANMEGITRAISQIKSTGRLQGDELMQLAEAGLNIDKVYGQIAKQLGVVDKNGESATAQVRKLQEQGKISSDVAIKAIMDSIKAQVGGKDFGATAAAKADKSIEGAAKRIGVMRDELVATMAVDWTPLTKFMDSLLAAMKTPAAREFADAVGKGLSDIMAALLNVDAKDMESGLRSAAAGAKALAETTVGIIEFSKAVADVAGGVSTIIGLGSELSTSLPQVGIAFEVAGQAIKMAFLGPILTLAEAMGDAGNAIKAAAEELGSGIISGIVAGIEANVGAVISAVKGAAKSAIDGAADVLGIASPSKVFKAFGANLMQSQALGVRTEAPRLTSQVQSASAAAVQAGQALAKSITNTSTSQSANVNVGAINVGTQPQNAGGIGAAVTDAFRSLFLGNG